MTERTIVIVGAGITGVSAAEWLRRDGWKTVLVDPIHPGDPGQTSFGNAGLIARTSVVPVASPSLVRKAPMMVFDPDSPLYLRWRYLPRLLPWLIPFLRNANPKRMHEIAGPLAEMTFDSTEQHMALARGTKAQAFITRGDYISLYRSRSYWEQDTLTAEIQKRFDMVPAPLTRAELAERDRNLGPDYTFGTIYSDFGWLSSPAGYVRALFDHYRGQGGDFRQASVVDVTPGEAPTVTLEGGEILTADKVVLSAGAWSRRFAKSLGMTIRLEAERGYHVSMANPSFTAPHPYMVTDAKFVLTPMQGALRAAGVVEFAGLDGPEHPEPPKFIAKAVKRVYPGLEFESSTSWMGRRPTTPDSLPAIGEAAAAPNVLHAYGGQHVGLTIGPKVGRLIADLAGRRTPNIDLAPYRPDRF
ncbi:NAD(P)/FAD-dependent oxidoreductase [Chachezhania antarctica]|uniref:NAD(P)/FAD-dependent oxidoreductase n=1 Tax=Chachezhania antarctica TaxID=2340860 RepID=UPI0013CEEB56|nr:FAD-binding oxidoreductase [Chachezhania antarctica]